MKVALVIHSQTGHTEYAAHKIEDMLRRKGQKSDYIKLQVAVNNKKGAEVEFKEMPDLASYDMLIFGSHVEAFSLSGAMKSYLSKIESLDGKKVICLLTQGLPYKWMGAKNALKQMSLLLTQKGAEVIACESISWSNAQKREAKMVALAQETVNLF